MAGRRPIGTVLLLLVALPVLAEPQRPGKFRVQAGQPLNDPMRSEQMRSDAELHDVCFVDPKVGWAVGDRGTIWHTDDGGRRWQLQRSGVVCSLQSVHFIDQQTGWAAGGFSRPYTHTSTGIVLITHDGGRNWKAYDKLMLPALAKIRFFDPQHGWAVGGSSAMFPSGVFVTDSGGRSWRAVPGARPTGWRAGDFVDPRTGVLVGRLGAAAVVRGGTIENGRSPGFGLRALAGVHLVPPNWGWLVGDGALVMLTGDLGMSWQTPPGDLPEAVAENFDFAALAVRGPRCWIAGSPGTRVLHTDDAGKSWIAFPTGQNLPVHGLTFADDRHGWAVGALGTILATTDGGRSWKRQRSGGTRAAVLGLFSRAEDVPLELFARLSGNEGYLGVVEVLNRRDVDTPSLDRTHPADRLHEALVGVGASGAKVAWRFPLRQPGLKLDEAKIIEFWDRANDGRGFQNLHAHLVRQIRLWRPEIVVTHDASPRGDNPRPHLINQAVLEAVRLAADPTAHVEQITRAGLEPWRVKKVYGLLESGGHGSTDLVSAELAGRLGRSLADVAAGPRGLIRDRFVLPPDTFGFRLMQDELPQQQGKHDFFSGIVLQPGGEARRELRDPPAESLPALRRIARKRRHLEAILKRTNRDHRAGDGFLAEAGKLTEGLDHNSAGRILYHLAEQYKHSGRGEMAAETLQLLGDRYPDHPLVPSALIWLIQYYASSEAVWRVEGRQRVVIQKVSAEEPSGRTASAMAIDHSQQVDRAKRAAAVGEQLQRTRPELFAEPAVGFPLSVVDRRRGYPRQAERFLMACRRGPARDAWRRCAQGEAWLADPRGRPPGPVTSCTPAATKPRLDGRLDDAVWKSAKPAKLASAGQDDAGWPAEVKLAYDDEFFYIAADCRRPPGTKYPNAAGPRPRDPDLSDHDRVELFFDLDRDHVTYWRLTIDHRGFTGEGCWGDRTWNPTWFVAAKTEQGVWRAEAAIPLDQLTGRYPRPRDVWAVGIQRIIPGVGFQSWSTPAAVDVRPEGFGYLIFE